MKPWVGRASNKLKNTNDDDNNDDDDDGNSLPQAKGRREGGNDS